MYYLENEFELSKCIGICADGGVNTNGQSSGFTTKTKNDGHPDILSIHDFYIAM